MMKGMMRGVAPLPFYILVFGFLSSLSCHAIEFDDVYKFLGPYKVIASGGLKIYYPETCGPVIPGIHSSFLEVKKRILLNFPGRQGFEVSVLLNAHDDRESSSADPTFDLITLGLCEEMGSLSTRAYTLEERFALRLASIMVLRTLGPVRSALKRRIGILSVPPWFLEGLVLFLAFPMDDLHTSRLFDMARNERLYTLDDLDLIKNKDTRVREEMGFQVHSMMDFLHRKAPPDAWRKVLVGVGKNPAGFAGLFRDAFGLSIGDAFRSHREWILEKCRAASALGSPVPTPIHDVKTGAFSQGFHSLPGGDKVWVSSVRYREEVYDLWIKKGNGNPRCILRNVHPSLWVGRKDGTVYLGKYVLSAKKQRRLSLWAVPPKGRPFQISPLLGCFKPIGEVEGRVFFTRVENGVVSVMTVDSEKPFKTRVEFTFPLTVRPLDLAVDEKGEYIYFVRKVRNQSYLCRRKIGEEDPDASETIFRTEGTIRSLEIAGESLWFSGTSDFRTVQLMRIDLRDRVISFFNPLPGGAWDVSPQAEKVVVASLVKGCFKPVEVDPVPVSNVPLPLEFGGVPPSSSSCDLVPHSYKNEFRSSYWLPRVTRDDQGGVLGVYSYRSDRLDRSRIVVSPTFGFKSRNWGYQALAQQRFDLFRVQWLTQDRVSKMSYRSNSYYERIRSTNLDFMYPFSLSVSLNFGGTLTHRGIAKFPEKGGVTPTVGNDNSIYGTLKHTAIRTEPFWEIFPRKGRVLQSSYRRGLDWFNGDMRYDSMSLSWDEYLPLPRDFVLKCRGFIAEDDKEGDIRRPEDLALGGDNYLRGYPGSHRYGDSLRFVSFHIGHPIEFKLPWFRSLVHKEIVVGEIFWERGDVRQGRDFNFLEDRGFEIRAKGLLFRRLPISIRFGSAWPNGSGPRHDYWSVDFSSISGLVQ